MDASTNNAMYYNAMKTFVKNNVKTLPFDDDKTHVSILSYGQPGDIDILSGKPSNKLLNQIEGLSPKEGSEDVPAALITLKRLFDTEVFPKRPAKVLIVFRNNGIPAGQKSSSLQSFDKMRTDDDVKVITVGLGEQNKQEDLVKIADNKDSVAIISNADDLYKLFPIVSRVISTSSGKYVLSCESCF